MTKYYKSKTEAEGVASAILDADDRVAWSKVELEPSNGWVVVVAAKPRDLKDLEELGYEIDVNGRRTRDPNKVRAMSPAAPPPRPPREPRPEGAPVGTPPAPRGSGITARCRELCELHNGDRAKIIAAAEAEGINASTAATQFSRWRKAKGG